MKTTTSESAISRDVISNIGFAIARMLLHREQGVYGPESELNFWLYQFLHQHSATIHFTSCFPDRSFVDLADWFQQQ